MLDVNGYCVIGAVATDTPPCDNNGALRTSATGFWDAAQEVPAPASRSLYFGAGDQTLFTQLSEGIDTVVTASDLNLVAGDLTTTPYSSATDLDELDEFITNFLRGCEFGTDCTTRVTAGGEKALLGDIFHSNSAVVGSPNSAINGSAYGDFALEHR